MEIYFSMDQKNKTLLYLINIIDDQWNQYNILKIFNFNVPDEPTISIHDKNSDIELKYSKWKDVINKKFMKLLNIIKKANNNKNNIESTWIKFISSL